jgi:pimeloyl-ACP methyl ester carboxylesterase
MGKDGVHRRQVMLGLAASSVGSGARARTISDHGAKVYWTSTGQGARTLVFVHGWTCDSTTWGAQVSEFSKRYRVITLDLPGHGRSQQPASGTYSMALFAEAVEAVRRAAGANRIVLIGHSMGGPVVRQYALTYPQHVDALVMVEGLVQNPTIAAPPRPARAMTGEAGRKNRSDMVEAMFVKDTPPAVRQAVLKIMLGAPEATAAGAMDATQDRSGWNAAPVTVPVLGIYADYSRLAPPEARSLIYPTMNYEELPRTGHFLMMEQPKAFNARLQTFLASLS